MMMTVKDVASLLQCSDKTVYSWVETGYAGIPAIKIGSGKKSLVRFDPADIHQWIQQWKKQTNTPSPACYNNHAETVAKPKKGAD
jgi:excisionase family DNA binding protein